ncbi:unnamed protein product [Closterium sp. NIES-64]|nr:unnamed protein product [Closterium sp. NIES-64]
MSPQSDPVSFQPEAVSSQSEPVSSQVPVVSDWDAFETQLRREADEEPIIEVNATTLNRLFELLTASNPTALTSPPATPSSSFHSTTPSPVLSRMGVYSVPALFLQNSTTRIRYRGPRTAAHLSEYISAFTRLGVRAAGVRAAGVRAVGVRAASVRAASVSPTSSPFSPLQPSPNPFATDSSPLSLWFGWDQPASAVTWGSKRAGSDSPSPAADSAQAAADSSQAGASTGASIHAEAEGGAVDEAGTAGEEAKPFLHGVASSFHMCPYMAALEDSKRQTRHLQQQQWWQQGGGLGVVRGGKGARGEGRRGVVCPYAWAIRPESLLSESFCLWFSGVFLMGRCLVWLVRRRWGAGDAGGDGQVEGQQQVQPEQQQQLLLREQQDQ